MKGMILDNIFADLYQQWMSGVVAHKECRGAKRPQMREGPCCIRQHYRAQKVNLILAPKIFLFSPKITVAFVVSA